MEMKEFNGKTLQEYIWNNMEKISEENYSVWDWVIIFEHYKVGIKGDKDYLVWVKNLKKEGKL